MLPWNRNQSNGFGSEVLPELTPGNLPGLGASDTLRFLSFNIQVGITTKKYRHYVTNGWKHVLPHEARLRNLRRIADVVADFDVVALQEVDIGSIRSGYMNQVQYLAMQGNFPYWYAQRNRDLGPIAQHGNGLLSRVALDSLQDHKLPGMIPGRGAIAARVKVGDQDVLVVQLHLSLGTRSRDRQLAYVRELIGAEQHVIVMGDLNSHLGELLFTSPLRDTLLAPAEQVEPTYPSWRPEVALDHVLVTPGLALKDYEVLDVTLSDHRPIAVTVQVAEEEKAVKLTA
ncbi:MAG: endonuclease/exonuclease/phosphatase family protein [Pseudomonadaceae bacterium]|nr:endonuclease/exonuclease/phosphatase family protein [Pseudomonadaceae bacterium]